MNIKPQRLKGEKLIAYRKRRREGNAAIKQYLKGEMVWPAPDGKAARKERRLLGLA